MCPFSLYLPKFSLGMLLPSLTQEVLVWLSLVIVFLVFFQPDDQVEMNIASLNGVEKKTRSVFFDILIEIGHSLVSLLP